jgi:cytochrome bd-type quinol oxidase subunit 2
MNRLIATNGVKLGDDPLRGPGTIGDAVNDAVNAGNNGVGVVDVFSQQFSNIIGLITVIAGVFFIVNFLIAGFDWIQSSGDSGKVEKARQRMVNSALGLLVLVISFGIIGVIGGVFGIELLNPGAAFMQLVTPGSTN